MIADGTTATDTASTIIGPTTTNKRAANAAQKDVNNHYRDFVVKRDCCELYRR